MQVDGFGLSVLEIDKGKEIVSKAGNCPASSHLGATSRGRLEGTWITKKSAKNYSLTLKRS